MDGVNLDAYLTDKQVAARAQGQKIEITAALHAWSCGRESLLEIPEGEYLIELGRISKES